MTVSLELEPEELTALNHRAHTEGVDIETVLHRLISQITQPPASESRATRELTEKQKGLAALLQSRRADNQADDPEELAERQRELEEFKANTNRWRAEEGRPSA